MTLVEDISLVLGIQYSTPDIQYKKIKPMTIADVYEDNRGALELSNFLKLWPWTKHIALKYHQFWEQARNGWVCIHAIDIREQLTDIFMKALPCDAFQYLCHKICGWWTCNYISWGSMRKVYISVTSFVPHNAVLRAMHSLSFLITHYAPIGVLIFILVSQWFLIF